MSTAAASRLHTYTIHGISVEIRADDDAVLAAIELRLRNFTSQPGPRKPLRIDVITGAPGLPAPPSGDGRPVYETPYGSLYYFPEGDALWGQFDDVVVCCEASRGRTAFRSAGFDGRGLYLTAHPLLTISLMELLERRGLFSLHAACLSTPERHGVLLAGTSGAGKSTLALALTRAGMSFVSDDIVFLRRDAGAVRALGFADAVGVTEDTAERLADARLAWREPPPEGFPKRLQRVEDLLATPVIESCVPYTLVFPEVAPDQPSELTPLNPGEALLRLAPDVLATEPASTQAHLAAFGSLLGQVSCFALTSGSDLARAAELVRALV